MNLNYDVTCYCSIDAVIVVLGNGYCCSTREPDVFFHNRSGKFVGQKICLLTREI